MIDLYARISKEDATDRARRMFASTDAQIERLREVVAERGGTVGKVFEDPSLSGWNPRTVRPNFDALMLRLESGESDGVAVYDLTRFSRKVSEGERLLAVAERGLEVWTAWGSHDLTTADGIKAFRDAMTGAAHESNKISERSSEGKRRKAVRGRSNATRRPFGMAGNLPKPVGWQPGDPVTPAPDDQVSAERDAIREVASMIFAGSTLASAARHLNRRGLFTPFGLEWSAESLSATLRRSSLAGGVIHRGEPVGTLGGEPVLDPETFARLTSTLAARRPGRKPSAQYLLTGILQCGRCGHTLTGRPRVGRAPYPDGEVAREYWCQLRTGERSGCGRLVVDQRFADLVITTATLERLGDPRHAERLAKRAARTEADRAKVLAEIATLKADALALAGRVAAWGFQRVDAAMRPLDARLATLTERLAGLERPDATGHAARDALTDWTRGDTDDRRAMIRRAFPAGIWVDPSTSRGMGARLDHDRFRFAPRD